MLITNALIQQSLCILFIVVVILLYVCTRKHPLWQQSIQVKLSLPVLFIFITVSIFCSAVYTYYEYIEPSEHMSTHAYEYKPRSVYHKSDSPMNHTNIRGLINLGSVHSATSTVQRALCTALDVVICSANSKSEFAYFPKESLSKFYDLFTADPSDKLLHNTSLTILGNWHMDIEPILLAYPFSEFVSNWNLGYLRRRTNVRQYVRNIPNRPVDLSRYIFYGKFTAHYCHPPTALVFSHMAYHRKWKFTLHIREPIKRLWSVQQHWHRYTGSAREIREIAADDIWDTYHESIDLQNIVHALKDRSVENDYIIGLYYRLYFKTVRIMQDDVASVYKASSKRNAYAFEVTASLYCVHVMFWLKHFERYLESQGVAQYFRILQYEYITKDLRETIPLIYCWFRENVDDMEHCSEGKDVQFHGYSGDLHAASDHIWSVEMSWKDRQKFIEIYRPCNERLNEMVKEKKIVLGEWVDYNALYDEEMKMNHSGDVVVDHPDRNTKRVRDNDAMREENLHKIANRNYRKHTNKPMEKKLKQRLKERKQNKMKRLYGERINA